jgi:hypothetical protein
MVEGCVIRDLPGGGKEFVVSQRELTFIRIDFQSRLQFGPTKVVIETQFTLTTQGVTYDLDPNRRTGLGPFLGLYPGTVSELVMLPAGDLRVAFVDDSTLTVVPHPQYEAWSVDMFWCPPGGFRQDGTQ